MNRLESGQLPSTSAKTTKQLLRALDVRPTRGKGQNFLIDPTVAPRIVDAIGPDPGVVVEIGPGLGALTLALAQRFPRVIAVELDERLARHLKDNLPGDHVSIISEDAMRFDATSVTPAIERYVLAANLPYSSAAAIVRSFLECDFPPERMVVMVQREVAERMAAKPPAMSLLGIATQLYASPDIAFVVPPEAFTPRPKVESAVIVLDRWDTIAVSSAKRGRFFEIVTAGFRHKRKTIANSMSHELSLPKSAIETWLNSAGVDPALRAQQLAMSDWLEILQADPETPTAS